MKNKKYNIVTKVLNRGRAQVNNQVGNRTWDRIWNGTLEPLRELIWTRIKDRISVHLDKENK